MKRTLVHEVLLVHRVECINVIYVFFWIFLVQLFDLRVVHVHLFFQKRFVKPVWSIRIIKFWNLKILKFLLNDRQVLLSLVLLALKRISFDLLFSKLQVFVLLECNSWCLNLLDNWVVCFLLILKMVKPIVLGSIFFSFS